MAKEPHDITHGPDGLRYFCVSRSLPGVPEKEGPVEEDETFVSETDYDEVMTGGEADDGYLLY